MLGWADELADEFTTSDVVVDSEDDTISVELEVGDCVDVMSGVSWDLVEFWMKVVVGEESESKVEDCNDDG